jgi:hypothetical protein
MSLSKSTFAGTFREMSLSKSTFAVSGSHIGKSMAFKMFFFPTESEQETLGIERENFMKLVGAAIEAGAALPDESEHSSEKFDKVAWMETCGKGARGRLATVLGEGMDPVTYTYGSNMSHFSLHGVYAEGDGMRGSFREVGGLKVRDVERMFQEELGDLKEYSPWMDIHVGWYDNDLASYARRFSDHSVPVLALQWPSADQGRSFYSLIVHAPDTQEVYEIISASVPELPREVALKEFPMTRHIFEPDELRLLIDSSGPTQLHISRSHYDLDAVKAHYKDFFKLDPVHEMRDADTGVGFVSFWHESLSGGDAETDVVRVQVMYWNRPDQSTAVAHTTTWLERRLEQLNSQYMTSYTSCFPVWGDNHYTVIQVPADYFNMVRNTYSSEGIGYMLFQKSGYIFTGYFPLPGGFYVEMQVISDNAPAAEEDMAEWDPSYCYSFTCPE